jgi:ABC-type nickel/cobalt efflux system permease component RcnA
MKTWIIKMASAALLFGFVFAGCAEHRYMERDRDDRHHHRDRDHHDDDHHDDDHHDNDNH